jgi:hypothetical protein
LASLQAPASIADQKALIILALNLVEWRILVHQQSLFTMDGVNVAAHLVIVIPKAFL